MQHPCCFEEGGSLTGRRPIAADAVADTLKQGLAVITSACRQATELHDALQTVSLSSQIEEVSQDSLVQVLEVATALEEDIATSAFLVNDVLCRARGCVGDRIIQAQEDERRHLAREMHDGPAQSMANLVMRVEICERLLAAKRPEVMQELSQLKMLVKESLREVRQIIFDLHPMSLDTLGLVPSMQRYFDNLQEREGEAIHFRVTGQIRSLPATMEVALFRMIQEAVSNARKHAQATQIRVQLGFSDGYVSASVTDDGVGFDVHLVEEGRIHHQSFGLIGMRERAVLLAGELSVESQLGVGTTVRICLPAPKEE
jgi:two-component system sensor histidine kinase DegS